MSFIRNLKLNSKLTLMAGLFTVGFLVFGAFTFFTISAVKVNSPSYQSIVQNKDLLADVLPPPNYIVETYLTARLMVDADTPEALQELAAHYDDLKEEYAARQTHWKESLAEGPVKQEINETSRIPAEAFFAVVDQELLPAVRQGNAQQAHSALGKLAPLYAEHRKSVNRIVDQTTTNAAQTETEVISAIASRQWVLFGVGLIVLTLVIGSTLWLRKMIEQQSNNESIENTEKVAAIGRSQAVIEFNLDGSIVTANENFLTTVGYTLDEIQGKHHSIFADDTYKRSPEYADFWAKLNRGEYVAGEFRRIAKSGKEVWIQASYNPLFDTNGKPFRVVKFASDITAEKISNADYAGQLAAISKSQAVIEFNLDGTIITANENFLKTLGYSLDEIKGRHHSMFADDTYKHSSEYTEFWAKLTRGEYVAGEFKRFGKGNKEIWIHASYNPILDTNGKPFKVVKYASDVTDQVNRRAEMARILELVNSNATMLGSSAEELSAVSSQMTSNAGETSSQATVVSAASEQVSMNVQTVSTGVEEMNSAIREIAKNASESARVAQQAVLDAQTANTTISKLGDSSAEIGKVIKVITSIAEQTNLLALNATIEAARAGEAGKGFAVVANEVKELAKETARATEDISRKIEAIQTDTTGAVTSIRQIGDVIGQINDISNTIASAVEEQTATATEMSRNVAEAAKGTSEIAQNISSVAQVAESTTHGATNCQQAAGELSRMANELQQLGSGHEDTQDQPTIVA